MTANIFNQRVLASAPRLAMPIAVYPGLALTGAKVRDIVTNPEAQVAAQVALQERYRSSFLLSAMDLSVEAEAFGCPVQLVDNEVPTVVACRVANLAEVEQLPVPRPGAGRTGVYLETVRRLRSLPGGQLVLGGCIGPFSLAARLIGVSAALELTLAEPELMHRLLAKSAEFLGAYVQAFQAAGADGLIMAEPAAGLLGPRGMATFSSAYIRQIAATLADPAFGFILHNCAAKLVHLPALLETGLQTFHFGAPMDLVAALGKIPADVVLCGNLDPAAVFCLATPEEAAARAQALLVATAPFRNFVLSSGCDVPPNARLANLDACYRAVEDCNRRCAAQPPTRIAVQPPRHAP
jgi:uroporphyrinogen decarboxylase